MARFAIFALLLLAWPWAAKGADDFAWPANATAAISLTFDDGRPSQYLVGAGLFAEYGARATFYVLPDAVRGGGRRDMLWSLVGLGVTDGWRDMLAGGHEIGSHTVNHPCSAAFEWVRPENATQAYTAGRMERELRDARTMIADLLKTDPVSFSYPCGETRIGQDAISYVPLAREVYQSARLFQHGTKAGPTDNDPLEVDLWEIRAVSMDDLSFEELLPMIRHARSRGNWIVLGGHEIGDAGAQTTRVETLERIIRYSQDPANGMWLAPVREVVDHIRWRRSIAMLPDGTSQVSVLGR